MKNIQLNSGFIVEAVKNLLDTSITEKSQKLFEILSSFEVESNEELPDITSYYPPILAVANNIISRGLPTRMSYCLEKYFAEKFNYLEEYEELGGKYFKLVNAEAIEPQCWEALHILDKRINSTNAIIDYENSYEKLDSSFEEGFLLQKIPIILGDHFIQLLESQRSLNEITHLENDTQDYKNLEQNFIDQRVDFSIQFPYSLQNYNRIGIIIEIDGSGHNLADQHHLDTQRDSTAKSCNWETIRIKTTQWNNIQQKLFHLINIQQEDYFQILKKNYQKDLTGEWLDILQFVLSPFGIARIQRTLVELIMRGILNLEDAEWRICIIERDIPCAYLALNDFKEFIENLFALESKGLKFPQLNVTVYSTKEFIDSKLNQDFKNAIHLLDETENDKTHYHVVLDVSVLQRSRLSPQLNFGYPPNHYFKIRSSHSVRTIRKIYSSDLIEYPEIVKIELDGSFVPIDRYEKILEYFLVNLFRKEKFKIGQLPILSRALSLKSVVGLLPTGGGKSLTYQLPALLQTGITVIVDPIKSLMKDQVDGLKRNLIDCCLFINSSMDWKAKKVAHEKISNAEALFVFVSPERLQMDIFRQILNSLVERNFFFSYCVIDEAHCVSEWGHDFRTSYLRLGENATEYCKTKNGHPITIFGLTATASFDVLSDILRAISNRTNQLDSDSIVRFETTNRPEIQFEVINLNITKQNNHFNTQLRLGEAKRNRVNDLLNEIPEKISFYNNHANSQEIFNDAYKYDPMRSKLLDEFNAVKEFERLRLENYNPVSFFDNNCTKAGLIFCPHKGWVNGVTDHYKNPKRNLGISDNIRTDLNIKKASFIGVDNENETNNKQIEFDNEKNQNDFINNKINLLVCTKAFGMGIDKPNVRFSIHINYPQSIESFVQESGRIGRDGKLALAYLLYNEQPFTFNGTTFELDRDILTTFHSNSFRGELKEKTIIHELLTTITYPQKTNCDLINDFLEDEGFDAYTVFKQFEDGGQFLFVNQNYGYINLANETDSYKKVDTLLQAQQIHQEIKKYIKVYRPPNVNLSLWLNQLNIQPSKNGIQQILQNNQVFELTIGFSNDWNNVYTELVDFLSRAQINKSITDIRNAHSNNNTRNIKFEDFYKALNISLDDRNKSILEKIFYKIRDKQDTEKAIYRLSILGIIDKYEVDYRSRTYKLNGSKKTDGEIKIKVREYLKKYYSDQRVDQELNSIRNYTTQNANNYLHKCIAFLIDFVYKEIAKKRKQAIDDMKYACQYRLKTSNIDFKDYIYYYFNSKYARKGYIEDEVNKSLYDRFYNEDDQPKAQADSIEVIWEFIEFVGSDINNFRHLRGACIRLIQLQPDYYSLYLLKSYAVFVIEQNIPSLLQDGIKDFMNGLSLFFSLYKYDNKKYFAFIDKYIDRVRNKTNNHIANLIDEAVTKAKLFAHIKWLEKTNNILGDMNGRRNSQTVS